MIVWLTESCSSALQKSIMLHVYQQSRRRFKLKVQFLLNVYYIPINVKLKNPLLNNHKLGSICTKTLKHFYFNSYPSAFWIIVIHFNSICMLSFI